MKNILKFCSRAICVVSLCLMVASCNATITYAPTSQDTVSASTAVATPAPSPSPSPTPEPTPVVSTVRFSASGDNLIHKSIYEDAATAARQANEGKSYDFTYVYENIAPFFADYDMNWINQETLITDAIPPSTYPTFCTPGEILDTLYAIGFRGFGISNNHTYDQGAKGIDATLNFWANAPEDTFAVGLYDDTTDEDDIQLQTINDITFAYVAYTFSTNGIPTPRNASKTVIYTSETERMQNQIALAHTLADVVVVGVHWGTEDSHTIHSSQTTLAQNFADWGADLIIGTHPHVLQDCEWLTAEDGHKTFVVYSLGNFVSAQSKADNLVGGILTIDIQKTVAVDGGQSIALLQPQITPIITHYDVPYEFPRVYLWSDYTEEMMAKHGVRSKDSRFNYSYLEEMIAANISPEFLVSSK